MPKSLRTETSTGVERALAAAQALAGRQDRELREVAEWLRAGGFPYDWSSTIPAPAFLRTLLADAWNDHEGVHESGADYADSLRAEQVWADD